MRTKFLRAAGFFCVISSPAMAGDFGRSCFNSTVAIHSNVPVLTSTCRKIDSATWSASSLVIYGIHNANGRLVQGGAGTRSTFQASCSEFRVVDSALYANCTKLDGSVVATAITLPISNRDGRLEY